jgi:hypothetical protein
VAHPFVHLELATADPGAAKEFYAKLFGWKLQDVEFPFGTYTMIDAGREPGGGIMKQMLPGAGSAWRAYVLVDDIEAATAQARALGATLLKDVYEVPGTGWLSIVADPTGAELGLWQPKM